MIPYIVYSHTEFIEILRTQTYHLKSYENKILLINKSNMDLSDLYSEYKEVLFYDDTLPYASRLLEIQKLNLEYALFIHDIDILVKKDDEVIEHLLETMLTNNIDRIDLQYKNNLNEDTIMIHKNGFEFYLNRQQNIQDYIYNVNPSIWKISTFMKIMNQFKDETYRSIEENSTQNFCKKYRIFKLYWESYVNCGHFGCMPFFQFIHITHGGKLLPLENNNLNDSLKESYKNILEKFSLDKIRKFDTRFFNDYYHGPSKKRTFKEINI